MLPLRINAVACLRLNLEAGRAQCVYASFDCGSRFARASAQDELRWAMKRYKPGHPERSEPQSGERSRRITDAGMEAYAKLPASMKLTECSNLTAAKPEKRHPARSTELPHLETRP
jgi:hypothetical protein